MVKKILTFFLIIALINSAYAITPQQKQDYKVCIADCDPSRVSAQNLCKAEHLHCQQNCQTGTCISQCGRQRVNCMRLVAKDFKDCLNECKPLLQPKCVVNETTYSYGEKFQDGCNICECRTNGKFSCKKEAFCNKNPQISKENCEESGGFYHALCNGPYFDNFCSQHKYCLCDGINSYTCPEGYECLKDFVSPNARRTGTIPGWRDMFGNPLGNIGVCVN